MSTRRIIVFLATLAVAALLVLLELHSSSAHNAEQAKRVSLTVLESSTAPIISSSTNRTLLASSKDGQSFYSLDSMTGELFVYDRKKKHLRKAGDSLPNVAAFTVGPQDALYLAQSDSTVQIINAEGRRLNRFATVYPRSIAVLGNGNIVVASPSDGKLLHLYSSQGALIARFGELRKFASDQVQNDFFNWGKVVVGSGDHIYYVSTYAPEPYVLRFSSEGELLGEFQIEGAAVDYQAELTRGFLSRRQVGQSGGITIITGATVNPETGHLFLSTNGLSSHGTIYEYDQTGTKLREYALLLNSNNKRYNVTQVEDITVSSGSMNVLTSGGIYSFQFSDTVVRHYGCLSSVHFHEAPS